MIALNNWYYQGLPIQSLPDDCVGFVYIITNLQTNRKYIGKKLAKFAKTTYKMHTQKNGIKKRKRIRTQTESDWRDYYGSSNELLKDIESIGRGWFRREILYFCATKALCSYIEAREQFTRRVLESHDYYNGQISVRVHGSHILAKF